MSKSNRLHDDTLRAIVNSFTISADCEIKVSIATELLERRNQVLELTRQRDVYARRHSDLGVLYCRLKTEYGPLIDLFLKWDSLTSVDDCETCEEADEIIEKCWDLVGQMREHIDTIRRLEETDDHKKQYKSEQ